jgi:hypothetical protein
MARPARTLRATTGKLVAKRSQRVGKPEAPRPKENKPGWPQERHSGEGSASALDTLRKMEKRRGVHRPREPNPDDPIR